MNDVAIRVEGISKRYRLGGRREKYKTVRDSLAAAAAAPWRQLQATWRGERGRRNGGGAQSFWALKDVSFEIRRGEVVGVIGRNGAGKSTLLKILSRITEPTSGYAEIRGRVGALLEVGTGFHQELTGRENVFLNGAILGMRREEIARKFEEIVEFAEVGKFIDTPVKHYSSGMHLRLAFSVAAHLEPEILLVDEVLAVGDAAFQKKCLGKMEDVASHGRTVLFVSHNLAAVKELCQIGIVLDEGRLDYHGPAVQGLARYGQLISVGEASAWSNNRGTHWRDVQINSRYGGQATVIRTGEEFCAAARLELRSGMARSYFFCIINDATGNQVIHQRIEAAQLGYRSLSAGTYRVRADFPPLWLAPGVYTAYFKFIGYRADGVQETHLSERALLDVSSSEEGISRSALTPPLKWEMEVMSVDCGNNAGQIYETPAVTLP